MALDIGKVKRELHSKIERFKLSDAQEEILAIFVAQVVDCEGGIPQRLWCQDCKRRARRSQELMAKFRKLSLRKQCKE